MFHGAAVAGFHEHFLSDDKTFGGHVLDAVLERGKIYSQVFDTLVQHLPVDDPDYRNHDFSQDPIAEAISSAEGDTQRVLVSHKHNVSQMNISEQSHMLHNGGSTGFSHVLCSIVAMQVSHLSY